jgi:hypothetical protein
MIIGIIVFAICFIGAIITIDMWNNYHSYGILFLDIIVFSVIGYAITYIFALKF